MFALTSPEPIICSKPNTTHVIPIASIRVTTLYIPCMHHRFTVCTRYTGEKGKYFIDKVIDTTLQTCYSLHLPALKMCTLLQTNVHTVTLSRGVGVGKLSLIHSSFGGRHIRTHPDLGPFTNDVSYIFGILDPLPPLSAFWANL